MRRTISKRLISWASLLDDKAMAQSERAASMPFVFPHLALMPDAHLAKGATVGSVTPTLRAIIPAAVGVDIGCGMIAVRTQFGVDDLAGRDIDQVMADAADLVEVRHTLRQIVNVKGD